MYCMHSQSGLLLLSGPIPALPCPSLPSLPCPAFPWPVHSHVSGTALGSSLHCLAPMLAQGKEPPGTHACSVLDSTCLLLGQSFQNLFAAGFPSEANVQVESVALEASWTASSPLTAATKAEVSSHAIKFSSHRIDSIIITYTNVLHALTAAVGEVAIAAQVDTAPPAMMSAQDSSLQ